MARKKGVIKQISNYGEKHPYVTLALAGTFGYYLYQNMTTVQAAAPLTVAQKKAAFQQASRDSEQSKTTYQYDDHIMREQMKMAGLGASTSTTTSTSSSHRMAGPGDGEPSMYIDPIKSGLFGLGATTRANPPAFLKYDQTQQLSGFSPSARRRVGHAGIGMASDSYKATLDTQFHNREAMIMGDLGKHQDILGFSGLEPLAGGDWYE